MKHGGGSVSCLLRLSKPRGSGEAVVSQMAMSENPRWNFCVHVDKAAIDSVLQVAYDLTAERRL